MSGEFTDLAVQINNLLARIDELEAAGRAVASERTHAAALIADLQGECWTLREDACRFATENKRLAEQLAIAVSGLGVYAHESSWLRMSAYGASVYFNFDRLPEGMSSGWQPAEAALAQINGTPEASDATGTDGPKESDR